MDLRESLFRPLIGLIEPTTTPVAEHEFHKFLPPKVWLATWRVPFFQLTQSALDDMVTNIANSTQIISGVPMDLLIVNSMTGTCLRGPELRNILQQKTGLPTVTAAQAVLQVLKKRHWNSMSILSNFNPELIFVERVFFNSRSVKVNVISCRKQQTVIGYDVADAGILDKNTIFQVLREGDFSKTDILFFDAPFFDLTDDWQEIEQIVQKPILSVNQVTLYVALKTLGLPTGHLPVSKYLD